MRITYVGNSTEINEEGLPLTNQVRYEPFNGALRRKYEIWENGKPVKETEFQEISVRHEGTPIPPVRDAFIEYSRVEDDQDD